MHPKEQGMNGLAIWGRHGLVLWDYGIALIVLFNSCG